MVLPLCLCRRRHRRRRFGLLLPGAVPARKARKTKRVSAAAGHAQPAAPAPPALNVAPAARPKGAGAVVAKKDKPCHFYRGGKGSCRSGDACEFSHTAEWKDARNPKE